MKMPPEETSPLLRQPNETSNNSHTTSRTRRRAGGQPRSASHSGFPDDATSAYSHDDFDEHNKKNGRLKRLGRRVTQTIQAGSIRLLPPLDNENIYEDLYNDEPTSCSVGTRERDGIWLVSQDPVGTCMSSLVWILVFYSALTVLLLAQHNHMPMFMAALYCTLCAMALASHIKTTLTDPGAIPTSAVPTVTQGVKFHSMCSRCQSYKPDYAHHCRICDRCVSRMDHHCPWMNNCIGAANLKHFTLFLIYVWTASALALILFAINYFGCNNTECEFSGLEVQLVRIMTWICICGWLFTSSMLMSVQYGVLTGVGTIDRLQKKATNTWHLASEEPLQWKDVFGIAPWYMWILPVDPVFDDYEQVMGFSTPQRLLRAQALSKQQTEMIGDESVIRSTYDWSTPVEV